MYTPSVNAQVLPHLVTENPKYYEPAGLGLAILQYNEWSLTPYDYLKENFSLTPIAQLSMGILPFDIQCNSGLELVIKPSKESAACVNSDSVLKFVERNWIHVFEPAVAFAASEELTSEESSSQIITKQKIPSDLQRAMSYVVTFSDASLTVEESQPIYTISKFRHISKITDSTIILPKSASDKPQFILEALPSLDKKAYYRMITDWINDNPSARLFDVKIDILAGNSETIQSWVYEKCRLVDYNTFLSENLVVFSFHPKFESEIREKSSFECNTFDVEVPDDEFK